MSGSASLPAGIALRDLMLALVYGRRRMLLIVAVVMAATLAIAVQIERKFEAKSSLLVLFGPEYSFRPAAGQSVASGTLVEYEQVLQTEAEILGNDDLYRSVISEFGIERLYPELLKPPGEIRRIYCRMRSYTWRSCWGAPVPRPDSDRSANLLAGCDAEVCLKSVHRRRSEIGCDPRDVQAPECRNGRRSPPGI